MQPIQSALAIAPYCPAPSAGLISLGAASKIRYLLMGLGERFGGRVTLINSGHQDEAVSFSRENILSLSGVEVKQHTPPTVNRRAIGKALQALLAPLIALRFSTDYSCKVIWLYNSYLFEVIFSLAFKALRPDVKIVLELEDAPNSRSRSSLGEIKVLLDMFAFECISRAVDLWTVVNREMPLPKYIDQSRVHYLPILLDGRACSGPRAACVDRRFAIGYFGGLSSEKGADLVHDVITRTWTLFAWEVCGTGPLEKSFKDLAGSCKLVKFHGVLEETEFRQIFNSVDAILNLHKPIESFKNGVFPYKILEAVAAGKIVISTSLSGCPDEIRDVIIWVPAGDIPACVAAISSVELWRQQKTARLREAALWVVSNYSYETCVPRLINQAMYSAPPATVI